MSLLDREHHANARALFDVAIVLDDRLEFPLLDSLDGGGNEDARTVTSPTLPSMRTVKTMSTQPDRLRRSAVRGYLGATYFVRVRLLIGTGELLTGFGAAATGSGAACCASAGAESAASEPPASLPVASAGASLAAAAAAAVAAAAAAAASASCCRLS